MTSRRKLAQVKRAIDRINERRRMESSMWNILNIKERSFDYAHLPEDVRPLSKSIHDAAHFIMGEALEKHLAGQDIDYQELYHGIRGLKLAKDAIVVACIKPRA